MKITHESSYPEQLVNMLTHRHPHIMGRIRIADCIFELTCDHIFSVGVSAEMCVLICDVRKKKSWISRVLSGNKLKKQTENTKRHKMPTTAKQETVRKTRFGGGVNQINTWSDRNTSESQQSFRAKAENVFKTNRKHEDWWQQHVFFFSF